MGAGPRTHIGQNKLDNVGMFSSRDSVVQLKLNHIFLNFTQFVSLLYENVFYKSSICSQVSYQG